MMFSHLIFTGLAVLAFPVVNAQTSATNGAPVTGTLGNATVVTNNPVGSIYAATLPAQSFFNPADPRHNIKGSISATANPDGIGVLFQVQFSNLPTSGGPFLYHLHTFPVPESGNCTETLGHLDPFIRGEAPACNSALPQTCQVGDLSGKHGTITSDPFTAQYLDEFASTEQGLGSFFGNRSMVVHFANVTRITCANFALQGNASTNSTTGKPTAGAPTATGNSPAKVTTNSASSLDVSALSITGMMGLFAIFL